MLGIWALEDVYDEGLMRLSFEGSKGFGILEYNGFRDVLQPLPCAACISRTQNPACT